MIKLKLIKYTNANVVEATWLDRTIAPDTEVPAVDAVIDEEGNVITEAVAAHTIPGAVTDVQLKCHSYSDGQIDMLRADVAAFGVPLSAEDEDLLAKVTAARVVPPADYSPDLYDIEYLPKPPYVVYERKSEADIAAITITKSKQNRTDAVAKITVTTTAGNTYDGDEKSQDRMSRAVACMDDGDVIPWVLTDNTVIQASRLELKEALKRAGAAMAAEWVKPYSAA